MLAKALANARPRPVTPHYAQFSDTFHSSVNRYLHQPDVLPEGDFRRRLEAALQGRLLPDG